MQISSSARGLIHLCPPRYAASMRLWPVNRHGCFSCLRLLVIVTASLLTGQAFPADPSAAEEPIHPIPAEDYAVYDRIVQAQFLTSETALILVRRLTATHIGPEQVPFERPFFDEN